MKIRHLITWPFIGLSTAAVAVTGLVTIYLISKQIDRDLNVHMDHASEMIAKSGLALNSRVLENLRQVVGAEVIVFRPDGHLLSTTLDQKANRRLIMAIRTGVGAVTELDPKTAHKFIDLSDGDQPYRVIYRSLQTPPGALLAFVVSTDDALKSKNRIGRILILVGIFVVMGAAGASYIVAGAITRPLEKLVNYTREIGARRWSTSAPNSGSDEIRRLAEAFDEMRSELEATEERLIQSEKLALAGQLAARVAHDVRNPMSSIRMRAQLLQRQLVAKGMDAGNVTSILEQGTRVEWVIQGLLDLAHPHDLHRKPMDVQAVLEEALKTTSAQLEHFHITVERRFEPDLLPVNLDPDRFCQALVNLISNAAETMPRGGILTVSTRMAAGREFVETEIADEGPGFPTGHIDKLFDPFFTTKGGGVGLGLVNARSVIERHGGRIRLENAPDNGARVIISLPVLESPGAVDSSPGSLHRVGNETGT
ncbi:MAG: signal transduction histidine kinase [Alphaproteobacteria bacterium]